MSERDEQFEAPSAPQPVEEPGGSQEVAEGGERVPEAAQTPPAAPLTRAEARAKLAALAAELRGTYLDSHDAEPWAATIEAALVALQPRAYAPTPEEQAEPSRHWRRPDTRSGETPEDFARKRHAVYAARQVALSRLLRTAKLPMDAVTVEALGDLAVVFSARNRQSVTDVIGSMCVMQRTLDAELRAQISTAMFAQAPAASDAPTPAQDAARQAPDEGVH